MTRVCCMLHIDTSYRIWGITACSAPKSSHRRQARQTVRRAKKRRVSRPTGVADLLLLLSTADPAAFSAPRGCLLPRACSALGAGRSSHLVLWGSTVQDTI